MSDIFELLKELDIKYPDEKIKFKIANFDTLVKLYDSLLIEKEKLEKALDKACKELYDNQMSEAGIDEELHGIHPNFINAEEWKEWCMKGD